MNTYEVDDADNSECRPIDTVLAVMMNAAYYKNYNTYTAFL
jgi:hypothetical protein